MSEHYSVNGIEQDESGFFGFTCKCGLIVDGFPDEETLLDEALAHGYNAGQEDAS